MSDFVSATPRITTSSFEVTRSYGFSDEVGDGNAIFSSA